MLSVKHRAVQLQYRVLVNLKAAQADKTEWNTNFCFPFDRTIWLPSLLLAAILVGHSLLPDRRSLRHWVACRPLPAVCPHQPLQTTECTGAGPTTEAYRRCLHSMVSFRRYRLAEIYCLGMKVTGCVHQTLSFIHPLMGTKIELCTISSPAMQFSSYKAWIEVNIKSVI